MGDGKRAKAAAVDRPPPRPASSVAAAGHTMGQSVRDSSLFLLKNIGQHHSAAIIWQGKSRSPPAIIVRFAHERSDGRKCEDGTGEEAHIVKKHKK
ncbi:hypothetical protein niasHT_011059 [Heterodera trifolii]|uniref:Uncharacterized protein n=1 Tax=Heterodera trifolii TaxID=157864 RepID=A0ABD2L956_9BILA